MGVVGQHADHVKRLALDLDVIKAKLLATNFAYDEVCHSSIDERIVAVIA